MIPQQGEIWLVPVPFSDLRASKRRPVLLLSNDDYHRSQSDCLVMAMTSQVRPASYGLIIRPPDVREGILPKESMLRADKVFSISRHILVRRFGCLVPEKHRAALALLAALVAISPQISD